MRWRPPSAYSQDETQRYRSYLESELSARRRNSESLTLRSPNGTLFAVTVADDGTLTTTAQTR